MSKFKLSSEFVPKGDQQKAIEELSSRVKTNKFQVLLGATGTGKTFTIANVIAKYNKPTLVIAHNKTLVGQLYSELKKLFPTNAVEYFVSYFDFYRPEAYLPTTDTYIEKNAVANQQIEMLRLSSIQSLLNTKAVIVVASVAAIYPVAPPSDLSSFRIGLQINTSLPIKQLKEKLIRVNYSFNQVDLSPGNFRVNGDVVEIAPGHTSDYVLRLSFFDDILEEICKIDAFSGEILEKLTIYILGPADEYVLNHDRANAALNNIENELRERLLYFNQQGKLLEAQRLKDRVNHDLESLRELGYCNGIENYARHLELRPAYSTPYTIFDYFGDEWLLVIDESHITIPQIRAMYNTDFSRKTNLVDYGFRLPSALDNRPLKFDEFLGKIHRAIMISATPAEYELDLTHNLVTEQINRPTGLTDPEIELRSSQHQIDDVMVEIKKRIKKGERVLLMVLTIKMAEELVYFLKDKGFKAAFLHNELKTLERLRILNDLRRGKYDCVVGINLLREGLDLPEVSLVVIFDADKPGFFRSRSSLIQIIGRVARNLHGLVIMYADKITPAMQEAIDETKRRREIQIKYNQENNITPKSVIKPIYESIEKSELSTLNTQITDASRNKVKIQKIIAKLEKEMHEAAAKRDYEKAIEYRDIIFDLQNKS